MENNRDKGMLFLAGGGEMGALTRAYDWNTTVLGDPVHWPQSLRSALSIVLNSRFPMFIFWGEELLCFYNDAYRPSLGNDGKHPYALGKPAEEIWLEIWPVIKPLIDSVLAGEGSTWSEDQLIPIYRNRTLEDVYWTFSYSPILDNSGKPEAILVTCTETTEKVNNLERLKDSERDLQFALEAAELGTYDYNPITDKLKANKRLRKWFGLPMDVEVVLSQAFEAIAEQDRDRTAKAIQDVLRYESGGSYDVEYCVIHPITKKERIVRAKGGAWYNEDKVAYRLNGTVQDVTEQRLFERELQEREQKFRLLADSMPQFVWTADAEGNLNYFNQAVYNYSGLSEAKIADDGWLQIVHPDEREENARLWVEAITTGEDFLFEHRFQRHDGVYRWQLSRAIPQRDADGKIQKWVGTSTDIEDQKMFATYLEREVQQRTKELEGKNIDLKKMNEQLQSFAYVSSHDLQEPLRKIQTFASRIVEMEAKNLSDKGKDYFGRMQSAANRMQILIDDLLTYSRTNTTERVFEDVDLGGIIEAVIENNKEALEVAKATITKSDMLTANIVPFQFHQLFENLLSNSLKFAATDRPLTIKISCDVLAKGNHNIHGLAEYKAYIHIRFSDNGIGFEPAFNERIFEIFQRLHTLSQYSGTGIGLAIVKKIVDNHDGIITASGELGKGATFDIYLPQ